MALFNRRNRDSDVLPEEVRDYYQAESRQRTGTAWFLAAATLILTILIAAVLFLAGRWVYRTVFDRPGKATITEQKVTDNKTQDSNKTQSGTTNNKPQTSSTNTTQTPPTASNSTATSPRPTTTPNTGPSELVNTGPND